MSSAARQFELEVVPKKPRLGFVGLGWIGRNRLESVAQTGLAEIAALHDVHSDAASEAQKISADAAVCSAFEELLRQDLDGVVIATPNRFHAEQAIAALDRGVSVFCQKPLARNAQETQSILDAAQRANCLLGVDLSYSAMPAMQTISSLVESDALGKIFAIDVKFHNGYGPDKPWFYDFELSGGGCVLDLGSHLIELALRPLGYPNITRVQSSLFSNGALLPRSSRKTEDYGVATIETSVDTVINLSCSWNLNVGCDADIQVAFYGTKGGAALRNVAGSFYDFTAQRFDRTQTETLTKPEDSKWQWGGLATIEWVKRLAADERFDPHADRFWQWPKLSTGFTRAMNSRVKRILMTADTVGGVWTYALELARSLQPYDVEVLLATMGPPLSAAQQDDARNIENLNVFKSNYKLEWMPECWADVKRAGDWLLHLEKRLKPDLVHLNNYAHASLPWNRPTLVVGHSCVFSWWQSVHGDTPPAEWQRYKDEVTRGLHAADLVVAPSDAMLRALHSHYGAIANARVIHNGRNPACFKPGAKQPLVLSAGRLWDAAKNIDCVAEIAPELPWPVFIAGSFESPQESTQQNSLSKECRWLGSLSESELRPWFASASIYALPALYEPFGYTPLEAALSGCTLVLGDIESLREVWGGAAVFVDPHDSNALQTELLDLIRNKKRRLEMSERARERALEFTSERMAQNYFAAYAELLANALHDERRYAQCA